MPSITKKMPSITKEVFTFVVYNYNNIKKDCKMSQNQIIVRPNPDNVVRKAEKLLKARYTLSQLAIKIITSVISMISKDDTDFKLYVLKIADFKELLNDDGKLGGSQYKAFVDACDELMTKKIKFDEGEDVGFFITRWAASVEYFAGSGEVEIEISQKLRPLLLQLKEGNYLNYELKNILPTKHLYYTPIRAFKARI